MPQKVLLLLKPKPGARISLDYREEVSPSSENKAF
jgi:hypothetical protein